MITQEVSDVSVSIVMAAYNAQRTIGDAIRSVLAQTCTSFELLICDDGSTDDTTQVVESFVDPRIKLLRGGANRGPGPSRDRAIDCARGTWVTFLDADDQYLPRRLETLLPVAREHPDDLVADAVMDCHDTPSGLAPWRVVWDERHFQPSGADVRILKFEQFLQEDRQLIKPFFRRELAMKLKASHGEKLNGEDVVFLFSFFANGSVVRYVPRPLYLYRMTPGSLSTKNSDRFRIFREVFEEGKDLFAHDLSATAAVEAKILCIRRLERYQTFLSPLRSGHLLRAGRIFMQEPWVIREFAKRVFERLPFHASRIVRGGRARRVGW
ncbi:glycosyltransferase family 2 protein [Variovorax dokdonensis]|uniref:Glycosyltransferase family 2 protein n=1 Tax=Variovorax dokdonensis TaxID=344883 RepID=A0ABT7N9K1_9BURK|nr:glycosyltransferase family 2 protein [Variovorax dokdonensis]MDM0044626.1 glycosyltransferase family 2 protein [Variovorax dokdonensis]